MLHPLNQFVGSGFARVCADGAGQKNSLSGEAGAASQPQTMASLQLSHTPTEHQLYEALLAETLAAHTPLCAFSTRRLMTLAQLPNYSAVRRALHGLLNKLTIDGFPVAGDMLSARRVTVYLIFSPEAVLARRAQQQVAVPGAPVTRTGASGGQALEQVAACQELSRREAEVALCCAEGLTNHEIGARLHISEQTVKYHLRHVFVKYGVKRRAELIGRLLAPRVDA